MSERLIWTDLTRECYNRRQRGLTCEGCDLVPQLETLGKCKLIWEVIEIYRLWGNPELTSQESCELSGYKICSWCNKKKPISEFPVSDQGQLSGECNECKKKIKRRKQK